MIAGVCGGLAEFYGISSKRVLWAFFVFGLIGAGDVVYIVLWTALRCSILNILATPSVTTLVPDPQRDVGRLHRLVHDGA
jgi:phage shock protein C